MKFKEYYNSCIISENLKYHLDKGLTLSECIFRFGSDSYCDLINEVRKLYFDNKIELSEDDKIIVERLKTGIKAVNKNGKSVTLDLPSRITDKNKKKKFRVWRDSGKKTENGDIIAFKIEWGDPNLNIRNNDDVARKSFLARHKCHLKKDQNTAGWWACNVHLFHKQLNLVSDKPW